MVDRPQSWLPGCVAQFRTYVWEHGSWW